MNTNLSKPAVFLEYRRVTLCLLMMVAFSIAQISRSQTTTNFTAAGNATWTCPSNVYTVQVEATGGGGGGGGCSANYSVAGGGAGGSYVRYSVNVLPGTIYNLTVGAGGTAGPISASPGGTGGSSYFGNTAVGNSGGALVLGVGGPGGSAATVAGVLGGQMAGGVSGGSGTTSGNIPSSGAAANVAGTSGGTSVAGTEGGAGAATSGAGGQGAPSSGGSYTGGTGGAAKVSSTSGSLAGAVGTAPGGGGSGGWRITSATVPLGGAGAAGRVALTYLPNTNIAGSSTVVASPTSVPADNTTTATVTVTLQDAASHAITNKTVTLVSSRGATDTISPSSALTSTSGVATFNVKSASGGTGILTANDTTDSITVSQTATVTFLAGNVSIDHFTVTPSSGSVTAGQVFTATVQAYSTNGIITDNSADGIAATMTSSGAAQFDANSDGVYSDAIKSLTNGAFTINVKDLKAESLTLTATVSTGAGTSSSIAVSPGAAAQLQVLLPGETAAPGTIGGKTGTPISESAGTGFIVIINAVDTNYNVSSSADIVSLTSSNSPLAILPANTALVAGTVTLPLTNIVAGVGHILSASDVTSGSVTVGNSAAYVVVPGAAAKLLVLTPGETATFGAAPGKSGSPSNEVPTVGYAVTVDALDSYYNLVTNNVDTVSLSSSDATAGLPSNAALVGGAKTLTLTNNAVGTFAIVATNLSNGSVTPGSSTVTTTNIVTSTVLASSANPANAGQAITLTATINGLGKHTGTVTFKSGATVLGTSTISGSTASTTLSGGTGTYSLTAVYGGDSNNLGSVSAPLSQVIQTGVTLYTPLMQDGFDYATFTTTSATPSTVGPWLSSSDYTNNANGTTHSLIVAGDLAGATSPDLKSLPNTTNPAAHYQISLGATDREFSRSIGGSITNGTAYWSFLLDVSANPTSADEYVATMLGAGTNKYPDGTDPVTLHARKGGDTTHYNLGIQRLGGTTVYATNILNVNSNYLIVLKYTFGPSSTSDLYINPVPGNSQPPVSSASATAGATPEPPNIGRVLFYENGNNPAPLTTGTYNVDVTRADSSWANVTPPAGATPPGAAVLAIPPAPQYLKVNTNSSLITVNLLDQNGSNIVAAANTLVSLSSSSLGGTFIDASDTVVITNILISAGSSNASFYYQDSIQGSPVITASSGLLTTATQTEIILPAVTTIDHFALATSVPTTNAAGTFIVTVQAIDAANQPITDSVTDGTAVTLSSSGQLLFDSNGDGVYGDVTKQLTNGLFTINAVDKLAETLNITAGYGPITGTLTNFVVTPGALAKLQLLLPGEASAPGSTTGKTGIPSPQTAGVPFNVTVNSVDANWNKVSSSEVVNLSVSGDATAVTPTNTALTSGTAVIALTDYIAASGISATVTDISNGSITPNTSTTYTVNPGVETQLLLLLPGETATPGFSPGKSGTPTAQYVTAGYVATVLAVDSYWNTVSTNSDTIAILSSAPGDGLPASVPLVSGAKTLAITNNTLGSVTLTATNVTSGSSVNTGSSTVVVIPIPTTTTLASSANPSVEGQPVVYTATVSGPGVHTGTVTFKSGSTFLGSSTLAGSTAFYITAGAIGTYSITAVYGGDTYNLGSTSGVLTQVVNTNSATNVFHSAQMQDGMDYALTSSTPAIGRPPWLLYQDGIPATATTSFIGIYAGDLGGATSPDILPIPNTSSNAAAHLQVATPSANDKLYFRSLGAPISSGQAYVSFLMAVTVNPTGSNETRCTMIASTSSNNATAGDPLTLHVRKGPDTSRYNLGIERLGGNVVWATNVLSDSTNYLVVLKYAFGSSSSNSLYINPTPGNAEPAPSAVAFSDGVTGEPANIGNVGFWESYTNIPTTSGTLVFDVLRADTSWASVTPSALGTGPGPVSLSFSSAAQTNLVNKTSLPVTLSLLDQKGNTVVASYDLVVSLGTSSSGGVFLDASSNVLTSVTFASGSTNATFYYLDTLAGYPVLTASSGLLTSGTQQETLLNSFDAIGGALPGFFSGVNLFLTNSPGLHLYVWSSTNNGLSVSNWYFEGSLDEQPLGGGNSRYSINVSPMSSPTYYVAGTGIAAPYAPTQSVSIITTVDFVDDFILAVTNVGISPLGVFNFGTTPVQPLIVQSGIAAGGAFQFQFSGASGQAYSIQASTNLVNWTVIGTGAIISSPVTFSDSAATNYPNRFYRIVLP